MKKSYSATVGVEPRVVVAVLALRAVRARRLVPALHPAAAEVAHPEPLAGRGDCPGRRPSSRSQTSSGPSWRIGALLRACVRPSRAARGSGTIVVMNATRVPGSGRTGTGSRAASDARHSVVTLMNAKQADHTGVHHHHIGGEVRQAGAVLASARAASARRGSRPRTAARRPRATACAEAASGRAA